MSDRLWRVVLVSEVERDLGHVVLQALTASTMAFDVVFANSLSVALSILSNGRIDAVLLILDASVDSGLEGCRRLHESAPDVAIVVLCPRCDENAAVAAVANGAQDCLTQEAPLATSLPRTMRLAIERIRRQRAGVRTRHDSLRDLQAAARFARLTTRQHEVLDLLVRGKSLKQIAAQLAIGVQAATKHRARIFRECEVDSVAQLVRLAFCAGLAME